MMMEDDMIIYKDKNVQLREMMCEMKWGGIHSKNVSQNMQIRFLLTPTPLKTAFGFILVVINE